VADSLPRDTAVADENPIDVPYGSNNFRLSERQWLLVVLLVAACLVAVPRWWRKVERFEPEADYRIPFMLSSDYWHYERWVGEVVGADRIPMIGDSVVWGEYVAPQHVLPQFLNQKLGGARFANGGLNGSHPLALEGLVHWYCRKIRNQRVLLHCNLLWMSSPERDLSDTKDVPFNHPRLVPQLLPRVPAYHAPADDRLGNIVDHCFALRGWVHHLRITHFDNLDLPNWSLEHPYENPLARARPILPEPQREARHENISWSARGIERQDFDWVEPSSSLQLAAFQRMVESLCGRGNSVFVVVGPFNEHLLLAESRERHNQLKEHITRWLSAEQVAYVVPAVLPSEEYADASHPLEAGYRRLAEMLLNDQEFRGWLEE
jgi:hypothetical protein